MLIGKIEGRREVMGRQGRRQVNLLEMRRCWKFKEEPLRFVLIGALTLEKPMDLSYDRL
jgi:hypothetical protein